ncbi:hypothetical protein [Campylobacter fetus]|nr:hypothetical protein [Campylobacter fetus]
MKQNPNKISLNGLKFSIKNAKNKLGAYIAIKCYTSTLLASS